MRVKHYFGTEAWAREFAAWAIGDSVWFQCEPWPDGAYRLTVKQEQKVPTDLHFP